MSFVNVAPQLVSTAAADAARIGSAINTANTAAAATTQVLAAAQDEVSTAIAALFGSHGQHYQAISAQVAAYQQRFVLALSQAGSTYAVAEAASATPLQSWIGSSAGLMVAAASPYVAWMSVTAGQAELTAAQVRVAAAAYETAYGLTVPPPVIAENRAELMILIATNLLGQNTPAIAVNEAEYGEMWAQDAAAMFGYAATAATATEALLPFEDAPLITNPGGLLEQAVAVEEAIDTAAANQLMNNVPQALQHEPPR